MRRYGAPTPTTTLILPRLGRNAADAPSMSLAQIDPGAVCRASDRPHEVLKIMRDPIAADAVKIQDAQVEESVPTNVTRNSFRGQGRFAPAATLHTSYHARQFFLPILLDDFLVVGGLNL